MQHICCLLPLTHPGWVTVWRSTDIDDDICTVKTVAVTAMLGGFYSVQLKSGLRLVMLNTNLYYYQDDKTANLTDPAGQLAWLDDVLKDAEQRNDSVCIC